MTRFLSRVSQTGPNEGGGIAALLDGSIPYLIVIGIIAATVAIATRAGGERRSSHFSRNTISVSVAAFVVAGLAFILAVVIRSAGAMPI